VPLEYACQDLIELVICETACQQEIFCCWPTVEVPGSIKVFPQDVVSRYSPSSRCVTKSFQGVDRVRFSYTVGENSDGLLQSFPSEIFSMVNLSRWNQSRGRLVPLFLATNRVWTVERWVAGRVNVEIQVSTCSSWAVQQSQQKNLCRSLDAFWPRSTGSEPGLGTPYDGQSDFYLPIDCRTSSQLPRVTGEARMNAYIEKLKYGSVSSGGASTRLADGPTKSWRDVEKRR